MKSRKLHAGYVLLITLAVASATVLARQDREQQAREDKAQRDWLDKERAKSEANITRREKELAPFRGKENEDKFNALQNSTQELVDLSIKINNQVHASGAQSVSVSFYSDLDKLEKLVKTIRKSAK